MFETFWWLFPLLYAFFKLGGGTSNRIDLLADTLARLQSRVLALESLASSSRRRDAPGPQSEQAPAFETEPESAPEPEPWRKRPLAPEFGHQPEPKLEPRPEPAVEPAAAARRSEKPREPARRAFAPETPAWRGQIKSRLFRGNLVARLGLLVLFIGISVLLKYVAAEITVPIERFAFTLGVGALLGQPEYGPPHELSAQLFLILFFLFYVAIALAYAARRELQRRDCVDVAFIFGAPLAALGLQYGMVGRVAFGMAFSVLALGLFYGALALFLWQRYRERLRQLAETFVAFGAAFGTLTVPLALSGRWTSAAWAVEGAAMVWLGLRQNKRATWRFGLLLEAAAWLAFIASASALDQQGALQARLWIGFLVLAASALLLAL
ncbi:MAG: DUF2339 domain-containing protein, partial [Burkholderiaceae bacterium]|nr:DUF2339 domain-containing protein [Burkholderiaceae bacterium]